MRVVTIVALVAAVIVSVAAKGKKSKAKSPPSKTEGLFDSQALRCLVCQSLVDEMLFAIAKVDPNKKIDTGTFRLDGHGEQKRSVIPYARSQAHLMELSDKVCKNFEDYAQATEKKSGKATIIRLTTPEGNMNPRFGEVDIAPDDDLNTKLKFYCEAIVEEHEEDLHNLLPDESNDSNLRETICVKKAKLCKRVRGKDEL